MSTLYLTIGVQKSCHYLCSANNHLSTCQYRTTAQKQVASPVIEDHRHSQKSLFQLARPARHAHHPFHRMRPRLLMQLQQISQTGRPLLLLDVFPLTAFMPFLARGLALYFRRWRGLSPDDVAIVQNTLRELRTSTLDKKLSISQHEDRKNHGMVAKICQPLHKSVLPQNRTKIYLSLSSPCEAFCLPDGSYEFIQQGKNGIQTMRWALRHKKSRRMSNSSHLGDASRLFTFSIIDPGTRRHAVNATMTRDWMEMIMYLQKVWG